jgi:hypothetical protein
MSWGFRNAYMAASNWVDYVQRARATGRHVGPGQYLEFRYEDLLSDPAGVLTRLELFILGRADANVHACALDEVGGNGILDNVNKWKSMMTPKEQGVFETVAGNVLTELGYESSVQKYKVSWFEASYWWIEHQIRKETRMVMRKFFPSMSEKIKVN